jgi:hypothetical protein
MLDCGCLHNHSSGALRQREAVGQVNFTSLFIGFHPDDVFLRQVSVDMAELIIVFGTIALSLGILVAVGNWWSR